MKKWHYFRTGLVVLVFTAMVLVPLFAQENINVKGPDASDEQQAEKELQQKIKDLIKQLGADDWQKREEATTELENIGEPAKALLEDALKNDDPEVRMRANNILSGIPEKILELTIPDKLKNTFGPDCGFIIPVSSEALSDTAKGLTILTDHLNSLDPDKDVVWLKLTEKDWQKVSEDKIKEIVKTFKETPTVLLGLDSATNWRVVDEIMAQTVRNRLSRIIFLSRIDKDKARVITYDLSPLAGGGGRPIVIQEGHGQVMIQVHVEVQGGPVVVGGPASESSCLKITVENAKIIYSINQNTYTRKIDLLKALLKYPEKNNMSIDPAVDVPLAGIIDALAVLKQAKFNSISFKPISAK